MVEETVDLLLKMGTMFLQKDQNATWGLFEDFAFPKIIECLNLYPLKRRDLLAIIYAYCTNEIVVHTNVITRLQVCIYNLR